MSLYGIPFTAPAIVNLKYYFIPVVMNLVVHIIKPLSARHVVVKALRDLLRRNILKKT